MKEQRQTQTACYLGVGTGVLLGTIFASTGRPVWVVVTLYLMAALCAAGALAARSSSTRKTAGR